MLNSDSEDLQHKFIKRDDTILHYCYLEMLRLSPAIPLIRRKAKEDFNLGDTQVFKGDLLELNIMAAHRDVNIWGDDADQFCPERFKNDPERKKLLKNFSPGKTPCLGKSLAEIEIKMMILLYASRTHHILKEKNWDNKIEYKTREGIILKSEIKSEWKEEWIADLLKWGK
jgi:cytochrome P450